jgi:hypothetical protein
MGKDMMLATILICSILSCYKSKLEFIYLDLCDAVSTVGDSLLPLSVTVQYLRSYVLLIAGQR